ncbi:hypothetical protein PENANT_c012G10086 [Penicillium antarcticum]|uniref:Uncharacterized protein n=1 Tax=Penicillium antarcticum TaxID=416450 RepID=A0A1V6Q617_9EURO|nr:uncharacterized protein N7508_008134 [Penicillium antarcticum]KAJ5297885.1 hypothetical protein N7508_008134 [Penicillium antarcticum]OQD84673.1 hypothetical protein PENANT_c012G10086 [Penicillium antarcticum]
MSTECSSMHDEGGIDPSGPSIQQIADDDSDAVSMNIELARRAAAISAARNGTDGMYAAVSMTSRFAREYHLELIDAVTKAKASAIEASAIEASAIDASAIEDASTPGETVKTGFVPRPGYIQPADLMQDDKTAAINFMCDYFMNENELEESHDEPFTGAIEYVRGVTSMEWAHALYLDQLYRHWQYLERKKAEERENNKQPARTIKEWEEELDEYRRQLTDSDSPQSAKFRKIIMALITLR